jgi:hypothetical protein
MISIFVIRLSALQDDIKDKLSQVDKVMPYEVTKKFSQVESENIGGDSKSEKRTIEALNLEKPQTNRPDPSSKTWVERMNKGADPRGTSGVREV